MIVLGLDPGLRRCGWGAVRRDGSRLSHIGHGVIAPPTDAGLAERLAALSHALDDVIAQVRPDTAAVEETFLNTNPGSTLKLGQARGVTLAAPARAGVPTAEYSARTVKLALVGSGKADKTQVAAMVGVLLPGVAAKDDAADALAVAICHANHYGTPQGAVA